MAGEPQTYTQEQVDALVAERIAAETEGLKKSQKELLDEAKRAKAALKGYEGVDPEEFKTLKAAADKAEKERLAAEGDFKSLEAQLVKKYETEIEKERGEKSRYARAMEENLIDAAIATELAKHSDTPRLLMPHIKGQMKVIEQDGKFHARIVDEQGTVRIGKGQGSSPMTLGELVEEMKSSTEFAPAFRGTGSSGGGASKSTGSAGGTRVIPAGDNDSFIANLSGIVDGSVKVAA